MTELARWLPVAGYEGDYEVSDVGQVRSLPRERIGRWGVVRRVPGKILKGIKTGPYRRVGLRKEGATRLLRVHRLVARAFVEGIGPVVRHLDGDSLNNCSENLAWGTQRENTLDTVRHGRSRNQYSKNEKKEN